MDLLEENVQPKAVSADIKFQPKTKQKPKSKKPKTVANADSQADMILQAESEVVTVVQESIPITSSAPYVGSSEFSTMHDTQDGAPELSNAETTTIIDSVEITDSSFVQPTATSAMDKLEPRLNNKSEEAQPEVSEDVISLTLDSMPTDNGALEGTGPHFAGDTTLGIDSTQTNLEHQIPGENNVEEQTQQNTTEANICHENRNGADDDWDDDWGANEPESAQADKDQNNDVHVIEDSSKQKRASRKSKKQTTGSKKTPRTRKKKASEETSLSEQEPPKKKKIPHGTRRRRQVDKDLLKIPEDELDPKQLSFKNLIRLAEAKEKNSITEAPTLATDGGSEHIPENNFNYDNYDDEDMYGGDQYQDNLEAHLAALRSNPKMNHHSFTDRTKSGRWSKLETEEFYKAVRQFGPNFEMIQHLFPNRTRHQVKLKYKNEERKNPLLLDDAIQKRPSEDNSCYTRLIEQLQKQTEENTQEEEAAGPDKEADDDWEMDDHHASTNNGNEVGNDDWNANDPNIPNYNNGHDNGTMGNGDGNNDVFDMNDPNASYSNYDGFDDDDGWD